MDSWASGGPGDLAYSGYCCVYAVRVRTLSLSLSVSSISISTS